MHLPLESFFLSIYNFIPIRMNEQKNLKKKSQNIERPF